MLKTTAFQIADSINIKEFKKEYVGNILFFDSDELFYENSSGKYVYVFAYGVVCFFGLDETEMTQFINLLNDYADHPLNERISEDFIIEIDPNKQETGYDKIIIKKLDSDILRLIMLNVAQSVSLDYFAQNATDLLNDTKVHTLELEKYGKVNIKGKKLKKFIGKSLNLKNRISQYLYIFDSHPGVWENEMFNKVDISMKKAFDLYNRGRNLKEDIQIVKDNLDLFKDIMFHRSSTLLEWIVIILILVEVINMLLEKLI